MSQVSSIRNSELVLPAGFRFHPTDQELVVDYLLPQVSGRSFPFQVIKEINLYKYDPWVLPSKAIMAGEKEWYFFSPRDKKYPNGSRPNRTAASGYWKATGTDKVICNSNLQGNGITKVGIKKALVFYVGKAPKGTKTNWIMHEYRLFSSPRKPATDKLLDDWVLCRIYKKNSISEAMVRTSSTSTTTTTTSVSQTSDALDSSSSELKDHFFPLNNNICDQDVKSSLRRLTSVGFNWGEFRMGLEGFDNGQVKWSNINNGNSCGVNVNHEICVVPSVSTQAPTSSPTSQEIQGGTGLWDPISLNWTQNDHGNSVYGFGP